ncbi:MAG TPA: hypothetical protein VF327_13050, partial [Gaiellaceae bacterium]
RLAATAPVVMVFEDVHYADTGLLDFVDHLLEWSRNVPIYVVTLARPELLERRPNWGAGKRNFTSLYLEPLPESAMRELLAGLVPGLPAAAVKAIIERADGMPLYAVETVRMLLAEGRLALENGAYHPVGDLANLAVPETLTALIASRLDGLPPDERALVADAAVLGQSFTVAALAAVSSVAEADLESRLRELVRGELLALDTNPRSPERGQYAFVQALIREVAYHTLAKRDRKVRHLAAARFFESLGSDELAGALAGHYLAAHETAAEGPEATALAAQARIALKAAAGRAAALGAHEQAVVFLRQALTVTTDPTEEADLLERAGDSASTALHHDEAETLLRDAIVLHRDLGDRPAVTRATAALGEALIGSYRTEQALAVLEPAADEFAALGTDPGFIALLGQLARAYMLHEEPARAVEVADRTLVAAERADLVGLVADTLVTRGSALGDLGRGYEGQGAIETGLHLAERRGLAVTALRARVNLGALLDRDDPRAAVENNRVGLAEARRLGQRAYVLSFLTNGAAGAMWVGDWDWALPELEELLASELEREDRILVLWAVLGVRVWQGETADELLAEIERLAADTSDPNILSNVALARADRAFARGELIEAAAAYGQAALKSSINAPNAFTMVARAALLLRDAATAADALAAFEATGARGPTFAARRLSIQAGLAALDGRPGDALSLYRDAIRRFRDLGLLVDEAFTAIEMATLLDPAEPEVRVATDSAREILTRLGATPFLERLEAAMSRSSEKVHAANRPAGRREVKAHAPS